MRALLGDLAVEDQIFQRLVLDLVLTLQHQSQRSFDMGPWSIKAAFIDRVTAVKQEAEQQLKDAGGFQDADGRWWWRTENGNVLLVDDVRADPEVSNG